MENCKKCGAKLFIWDVKNHKCPEDETQTPITSAEEAPATDFLVQHAKEEASELIQHVLTEEDFDANPDLALQGLNVGEEIRIGAKEDFTANDFQKQALAPQDRSDLTAARNEALKDAQSEDAEKPNYVAPDTKEIDQPETVVTEPVVEIEPVRVDEKPLIVEDEPAAPVVKEVKAPVVEKPVAKKKTAAKGK